MTDRASRYSLHVTYDLEHHVKAGRVTLPFKETRGWVIFDNIKGERAGKGTLFATQADALRAMAQMEANG